MGRAVALRVAALRRPFEQALERTERGTALVVGPTGGCDVRGFPPDFLISLL